VRLHASGLLLRYVGFTALVVTAVVFWHYAGPLTRSNRHRQLAAQRSIVESNDPKQLLAEANRLAWLFNGPAADPLYARAEALFAQAGDHRNELYAKIGRIRAEAETMSFVDISNYLAAELKTPLVQSDPELKLWCLTSKGYTDIETDRVSAKRDWEQVQALAKTLGERKWEIRAQGELGLIAFLEGNSAKADRLVGGALLSTMASGDVGGQIRYLELIGTGLDEIKRPEEAIPFFDRAINLAARTADAGFPFMAYEGKAEALSALGKADEARATLTRALDQARANRKRGHEADLLILLGKLSEEQNDKPQAIECLEKAGSLASDLRFYRMVSDAYFELAKIYRGADNLAKAEVCLTRSLDASSRVGDRYYVPQNLTALAELKAREGQRIEADTLYEPCLCFRSLQNGGQPVQRGSGANSGSGSTPRLKLLRSCANELVLIIGVMGSENAKVKAVGAFAWTLSQSGSSMLSDLNADIVLCTHAQGRCSPASGRPAIRTPWLSWSISTAI